MSESEGGERVASKGGGEGGGEGLKVVAGANLGRGRGQLVSRRLRQGLARGRGKQEGNGRRRYGRVHQRLELDERSRGGEV